MRPARQAAAFVLDSWPLLAYFEDEPAASAVEQLLGDAHEKSIPLLMSVVNVAEVWYTLARQTSADEADESLGELRDLGIQFVPAEINLARQAARYKATYRMSLADCFAAALAQQQAATLVTGDPEFKQVDGELRIVWLPLKL